MLVIGELVHEGEEECDPERIPRVHEDVLVLFGLEERDGMDLELTERAAVEGVEQAMQMPAQFVIEARDELCEFLLNDGGSEVNVPRGQAGEGCVAREQTMQESGAASQIADDDERFFDGLCFVRRVEDVIKPEEEPRQDRAEGPDRVEERKKDNASSVERSGCVFGGKERTVERAPEQAEVVVHRRYYPLVMPIEIGVTFLYRRSP